MISRVLLLMMMIISPITQLEAQNISEVKFCDRKYEYQQGKDSITLFFNMINQYGKREQDITIEQLKRYLVMFEDDKIIPTDKTELAYVNSGQRIPEDYTFSVLIDQSIPQRGKEQIYETVSKLIESAPDSCVYISFFGDVVTSSLVATKSNYGEFKNNFLKQSENKYFNSGLYAKLIEFGNNRTEFYDSLKLENDYQSNTSISNKAKLNKDKNILFVFTEGSKRPSDEYIDYIAVTDYQRDLGNTIVPKVFALYYTEEEQESSIKITLEGICTPRDRERGDTIKSRLGEYMPSNDMNNVLKNFEKVVNDAMYDFAFKYKVDESMVYSKVVSYKAEWKGVELGEGKFSIGTAENPWPIRQESTGDTILKYIYALFIAFVTIAFFFAIAKILIPFIQSKSFALKYYKKYVPEANVTRRTCCYCKQEIQPGQTIVTKCKHLMHVFCWQQNGYKCAEYGQNCKTGIQSHIEWKELFTMSSLKECYQTFSGIIAGFISWILYELFGRGVFEGLSETIVSVFYKNTEGINTIYQDCVNKTSAFLTIGLLLGLFLSLIFRYNDEYKKKDLKVWGKIIGLSVLTSIIGMTAFAIGANILCLILSATETTYIPWYCSLPAYMLFSISVSLALTIKSTIPLKSAMIGGLCSSLIGFIVLYCSSQSTNSNGWMNMLLDFIIYGGGLGASLVTVRMLAEKYFLIIQNGVRAGQKIPIHKWMNATGGGNKVSIGMTGECEIQMNWEKSNKVAKEHAQLFIDYEKQLPMIKPLAAGVIYNNRAELPVNKPSVLSNGDTFKIGDTIFLYQEND